MSYLPIIALMGLGIVVGVMLANYLAERKAKAEEAPVADAPTEQPAATTSSPPAKRRFWFGGKDQNDQIQTFQNWTNAKLEQPELRAWLGSLNNEQLRALIEQLDTFCHQLGFDLAWLTNETLQKNPELEAMALAVVEHYCSACCQAASAQNGFQQFRQLLDLVEQPFNREHKPISQQIYADLVRRDIVPAMAPDLMVATEQARQTAMANAVKDVAATNWPALAESFNTVTSQEDAQGKAKDGWSQRLRNPFRSRETASSSETVA